MRAMKIIAATRERKKEREKERERKREKAMGRKKNAYESNY